jgi:hypothetical protein
MATTDIDICARALIMIGAEPITSFADGTTESKVASNLYSDTIKNILSAYRWRFASKQTQLSRLTDTPDARWDSAYQLPSDMLSLHTIIVNDKPIKYNRYGDMAYCNATSTDKVYADYTYYDEGATNPAIFFPAYFIYTAELTLASLFAFAVAQNTELSVALEQKAGRQLAFARNMDSQQNTTKKFVTSRFINARNSKSSSQLEGIVEE